jgi:heme-degrading monooxygenase HmoA
VISRIWHGWTTPENADVYESLLKGEIFRGIQGREIEGYQGINLLRRDHDGEVEFVTIMWFDDIEAVRSFAGEDYEVAVVPKKARAVLSRFDERSKHYEVKEELKS